MESPSKEETSSPASVDHAAVGAPHSSRFAISLRGLLLLMAGIGIGFAPAKIWEIYRPKADQVIVHMAVIEVPTESEWTELTSEHVGVFSGVEGDQLLAKLQSNGKLLSAPSMIALVGRRASFHIGAQVPIVSKTGNAANIKFQSTGFDLEFVPTLLLNGQLEIELTVQNTEPQYSSGQAVSLRQIQFSSKIEAAPGGWFAFRLPSTTNPGHDVVIVGNPELFNATPLTNL